jgi:hypothetical protein
MQNCECRLRGGSLLILAWLLGVVLVSASGLLAHGDGATRLLMPALIVLPVAAFALAWRGSETFRSKVLALDTGVLVMLHSWRMVGMGFLFLYAHNVLPGPFAWLAGVGDMLAAAGAMVIGTMLLKGKTVSRQTLWRWNTFGLLDFVVAVVVGTALRSVYFGGTVNTDVMAQLPLSLVPTVIVPLYIITHVIVYLQLRAAKDRG